MNNKIRIVIVGLCLLAAVICYVFGVPAGGGVFIVLGLLFETLFWIGLLRVKNKRGS